MTNYEKSQRAIVQNIVDLLESKSTRAVALSNATARPHTIYYTTDTKEIIIGGVTYGRGDSADMSFFTFAQDTSGQSSWDTHRVYLTPYNGGLAVWVWETSVWANRFVVNFNPATSAADISYDPTASAIEATDVQTAIDKVEGNIGDSINNLVLQLPSDSISAYGYSSQNKTVLDTDGITVATHSSTTWNTYWSLTVIPKGTVVVATGSHSTNTVCRWALATSSPQEFFEAKGTVVGFKADKSIWNKSATDHSFTFVMPYDAYIIFSRTTSNVITTPTAAYHDVSLLSRLYDTWKDQEPTEMRGEYVRMSSEAGLGYNIFDYVDGVDQDAFAYGCKLYRDNLFKLTGSCASKFQNDTRIYYLPAFNMSEVTSCQSMLSGCTQIRTVKLSLPEGVSIRNLLTNTARTSVVSTIELGDNELGDVYGAFNNCTVPLVIKRLHTKNCTSFYRTFYNATRLRHVEGVDFDSITTFSQTFGNGTTGAATNLRHLVIYNLGMSSLTAYTFASLTNWGVASDAEPDARQSLIDTLITHSFDRAAASLPACTLTLSANTKALLTADEINQITAKGFTIA